MSDETLPTTIEPAFTPDFIAYLIELERQRHDVERSGVSWTTFFLNAMTQGTPKQQSREREVGQ